MRISNDLRALRGVWRASRRPAWWPPLPDPRGSPPRPPQTLRWGLRPSSGASWWAGRCPILTGHSGEQGGPLVLGAGQVQRSRGGALPSEGLPSPRPPSCSTSYHVPGDHPALPTAPPACLHPSPSSPHRDLPVSQVLCKTRSSLCHLPPLLPDTPLPTSHETLPHLHWLCHQTPPAVSSPSHGGRNPGVSSPRKDTSHTGLRPTLTTPFNLDHLFKGPDWGPGGQGCDSSSAAVSTVTSTCGYSPCPSAHIREPSSSCRLQSPGEMLACPVTLFLNLEKCL